MSEQGKTHKASVLAIATDKRNGLSVLLAAASLLGVSVGYAGAATEPAAAAPADSSSRDAVKANPAQPNIRLAAQLAKVPGSTPQVHVNVGKDPHVNTGVNSSAIKFPYKGANTQFLKGANSQNLKIKGANANALKVDDANSNYLKIKGANSNYDKTTPLTGANTTTYKKY